MSDLNRKITHSINYLINLNHVIKKFYTIFDKGLNELRNKKDDSGKTFRKINRDLKNDIEDEMEKLLIEFTIYNSDMTEIIINRNNPDVVYSLKNFISQRQQLKETKKRLYNFLVKTEAEVKRVKQEKDYVKLLGFNTVYYNLVKFYNIIDKSYNKLCSLTKDVIDDIDNK